MNTKLRREQIVGGVDGWIPVLESWVYASTNTITVPSGATNRFQKGDKIKFTNNGTTKYFYIVNVTSTVLTVTGGSDYIVHNSAISDIYVSRVENPFGFPHWFNWEEEYTGFSVNPTSDCRFRITGNTVSVIIRSPTAGTSNANFFTISAPVQNSSMIDIFGVATAIVDNGVNLGVQQVQFLKGATVFTMQKDNSAVGWTSSGNKRIVGLQLSYQMA